MKYNNKAEEKSEGLSEEFSKKIEEITSTLGHNTQNLIEADYKKLFFGEEEMDKTVNYPPSLTEDDYIKLFFSRGNDIDSRNKQLQSKNLQDKMYISEANNRSILQSQDKWLAEKVKIYKSDWKKIHSLYKKQFNSDLPLQDLKDIYIKNLKGSTRFSLEEDKRLMDLNAQCYSWDEIARIMKNRKIKCLQNRFYYLNRKNVQNLKSGVVDKV